MSAYDHPNVVTGEPNVVPGAVSQASIDRRREDMGGDDSPLFQSRVRGISPSEATDALIKLEWCFRARDCPQDRRSALSLTGPAAIGVDVANSLLGDKGAIARGQGAVLLEVPSPTPARTPTPSTGSGSTAT